MGAGRFFCVALPLILTIASIGTLLYAVLAGAAHQNTYILSLDLRNLSIDPINVDTIGGKVFDIHTRQVKTGNITAADLALADTYTLTLWGYCSTDSKGQRNCSKSQFDWASKSINTSDIQSNGVTIQFPKEVQGALKTFATVTRYANIAFVVALVALGLELIIGIFANFSRVISCVTWLESLVTTVLVFAAAGLATSIAVIVVGAVDSTAKFYGVRGDINGRFLAIVWIGAAFALGATLFWIFTICCCKPDRSSRKNRGTKNLDAPDGEKLLPTGGFQSGGYAPLNNEHEMTSSNYYNPSQPRFAAGNGRSDLAYEPYSHRA